MSAPMLSGETHASTAVESAEEHASSNPLLRPEPGLAIWTVITFVVLLVVLKRLAWGPILDNLDKRQKAIADSLDEAEKARAEAKSSFDEQQKALAESRREAQELLAQTRASAERAREEMVTRARTEADKIIESGRQAIELEKRAAIQEVRTMAVDLALSASSKLMRSQMDDDRNRQLVTEYVRELEDSARSV